MIYLQAGGVVRIHQLQRLCFDKPMCITAFSDAFGLSGGLVVLAPDWTIRGFDAFNPSGVIANHIAADILGILGGAFHLS